jgi:hypothetical protein
MHRIEVQCEFARSADEVFAFLMDVDALRRWRSVESVRLEPHGPPRVGARLVTSVRAMGQPMSFTNQIVELDRVRRRFRDVWLKGTFAIQNGWDVHTQASGARLLWVTHFTPPGLLAFTPSIVERRIRDDQQADLVKLKRILDRK